MTTNAPTWDDVATLARAASALLSGANLTHDLTLELAGPIIRRMAAMLAVLETDQHGDAQTVCASDDDSDNLGDISVNYQAIAVERLLREHAQERVVSWSRGAAAVARAIGWDGDGDPVAYASAHMKEYKQFDVDAHAEIERLRAELSLARVGDK